MEVSKVSFDLRNSRVVVFVSYPSPVYYDSVEGAKDDVQDIADDVARWISKNLGGRTKVKPCIVLSAKNRVAVSKEISLSNDQIMAWTALSPFSREKATLTGIVGREGFVLE